MPGLRRSNGLTDLVGQRLTEAGEADGFEVASHRTTGAALSAWSYEPSDETLHLVVTDYRGQLGESLTATQIATWFKRLTTFTQRSMNHLADSIEPSSPVFEVADFIRAQWKTLSRARFYLFSDGLARNPETRPAELEGVAISFHVWDVERLYRLDTSGLEREPIAVDVSARTGSPLPCLPGPPASDHQVFLALVPATLLADLYNEFTGRILERNVRSFLQQRGGVNKGIRDTILKAPERFLAYNNGISATASAVDIVELPNRGYALTRIHDLQIVNGGQTTASLAAAVQRDKADVSGITVQCKLTVVPGDVIDELVPHISQFSNTQNKVTGADFSSNDPFHIKIEELSRSVWAPPVDGSQKQTQWFFERARGQYADEYLRARTPARQRQFKSMNPLAQKFTKTDLAKFENSWEQLPHLVSTGAEKNFREFMELLEGRRREPDLQYFRRLIAKAILFRSTEKLVSDFKFGDYRANIVTYTIAKLANATSSRLDLDAVWQRQALSPATASALKLIIPEVKEVIFNPTGRSRHIGEWCKKPDCWAQVKELDWRLPPSLTNELVALRGGRVDADLGLSTPTVGEQSTIEEATGVEADVWFGVANWAKETNNLQAWQRGLAFSLGKIASSGKEPSYKQSVQGLKLLAQALDLGFR